MSDGIKHLLRTTSVMQDHSDDMLEDPTHEELQLKIDDLVVGDSSGAIRCKALSVFGNTIFS